MSKTTVFGSSTIKRNTKVAKGRTAKGIPRLGNVTTNVKVENTYKSNRALTTATK